MYQTLLNGDNTELEAGHVRPSPGQLSDAVLPHVYFDFALSC